jgi:hypothetical protein
MVDAPETEQHAQPMRDEGRSFGGGRQYDSGRRQRRPKPAPFQKEMEAAQKRKEEMERREKLREMKDKDRVAMTRAKKPDQFGKRRLGRESKVLLDRVKRITGKV